MFRFLSQLLRWFRRPSLEDQVLGVPEIRTAGGMPYEHYPSTDEPPAPELPPAKFRTEETIIEQPFPKVVRTERIRDGKGEHKVERLPKGYRDSLSDTALEFLELVNSEPRNSPWALKAVGGLRQAAYDNLVNIDFSFIDDDTNAALLDVDEKFVTGTPAEQVETLGGSVDFAAVLKRTGEDEEGPWKNYSVWRIASVSFEQIRNLVTITPKHPLLYTSGTLFEEGVREAHSYILGEVNNKWVVISNPKLLTHTLTKYQQETVPVCTKKLLALALARRYTWHAALGDPNGSRLILPSSAEGCSKLFIDRDKPAEGRRAALKHWVEQFYREKATDEKDLVFVRTHLRGATKFSWRGLGAEIMVSQFDLERNEFFKNQAEEWRAQRKHNSVKVRLKERK